MIIDTGVLIRLEKDPAAVEFSTYKPAYGEGFISSISKTPRPLATSSA